MDYPKLIVLNQKEESISIQRVKWELNLQYLSKSNACSANKNVTFVYRSHIC